MWNRYGTWWALSNTSTNTKVATVCFLLWLVHVIGCVPPGFGSRHGCTSSFSAKKNCGCGSPHPAVARQECFFFFFFGFKLGLYFQTCCAPSVRDFLHHYSLRNNDLTPEEVEEMTQRESRLIFWVRIELADECIAFKKCLLFIIKMFYIKTRNVRRVCSSGFLLRGWSKCNVSVFIQIYKISPPFYLGFLF